MENTTVLPSEAWPELLAGVAHVGFVSGTVVVPPA
jgi:hypothetical protein